MLVHAASTESDVDPDEHHTDAFTQRAGEDDYTFGGIVAFADTMAPGADIAWEATNTFEGVEFDAAKCSAADLS